MITFYLYIGYPNCEDFCPTLSPGWYKIPCKLAKSFFNCLRLQPTYVGDVGTGLADGGVLLDLPGEGPPQVHGAAPRLVRLQPQHARARQLVVGAAPRALLLHLHHVNRVPAALDLFGIAIAGLLDQYHSWKTKNEKQRPRLRKDKEFAYTERLWTFFE